MVKSKYLVLFLTLFNFIYIHLKQNLKSVAYFFMNMGLYTECGRQVLTKVALK